MVFTFKQKVSTFRRKGPSALENLKKKNKTPRNKAPSGRYCPQPYRTSLGVTFDHLFP